LARSRSRRVAAALRRRPSEKIDMDIEDRLKKLQSLFSYALSGAVCAKAQYLSLKDDRSATLLSVRRAEAAWRYLERQKTDIIARMVALEELERDAVA
jgi:hypothetical protein